MPDYIPQANLPQGLADEVLRLANARKSPWESLANGVSNLGASAIERYKPTSGNLTPEQIEAFRQGLPRTVANNDFQGPAAPGQMSPGSKSLGDVFPRGVPSSLAEQVSKQREQESIAKITTDRMMGLQGLKGDQLAAKDHTPVTDEMLKNYPSVKKMGFQIGELVPNRFINDQNKADAAAKSAAGKSGIADEKLWEGINKQVNPINAPRGSLLGQAGQGNARADRALTTLNSKTVTPQQIQAVVADYAGIMQGGAPHEIALRQMGYDNLATRWANFKQFITSNPKAVNTPEVVSQLRDMIKDIKKVDNEIIKNNLDTVEQTHSGLIQKDAPRWSKIRGQVMKSAGESPAGHDNLDALIDKHLGGQ